MTGCSVKMRRSHLLKRPRDSANNTRKTFQSTSTSHAVVNPWREPPPPSLTQTTQSTTWDCPVHHLPHHHTTLRSQSSTRHCPDTRQRRTPCTTPWWRTMALPALGDITPTTWVLEVVGLVDMEARLHHPPLPINLWITSDSHLLNMVCTLCRLKLV